MDSGTTRKLFHNMRFTHSLFILGLFYVTPFACYSQVDPVVLGHADPKCWESSSAILLEMRKSHVSDSVSGFWDFMIFLKMSEDLKHGALFWDLAQLFWDIYVDCVLSRTHGLGKRQLVETQQQTAALPSWIIMSIVSQIQMAPVWKKDLKEDLIRIHVHKSRSASHRIITGYLRMKTKHF